MTTIQFHKCGSTAHGPVEFIIAVDRAHKKTCRTCFPEEVSHG